MFLYRGFYPPASYADPIDLMPTPPTSVTTVATPSSGPFPAGQIHRAPPFALVETIFVLRFRYPAGAAALAAARWLRPFPLAPPRYRQLALRYGRGQSMFHPRGSPALPEARPILLPPLAGHCA